LTIWHKSWTTDPIAREIADRHYSRKKPGSRRFVNPARALVLLTNDNSAVWVTTFPYACHVRHAWPEAWQCAMFRNESNGKYLSSDLIRQAVAITRWYYGIPPTHGMITFIDANKVKHKRDPGRCFKKAGFNYIGYTKGGLIAMRMLVDEMPTGVALIGESSYRGDRMVHDVVNCVCPGVFENKLPWHI
jgi:hypothetical protein